MREKVGLLILVSIFATLVGCSSTTKTESVGDASAAANDSRSGANVSGGFEGSATGADRQADLLAKRVIYFDFDSSEVTAEARDIAAAHAQKLLQNPNMSVVLEGHTDERGTREYNVALGERRAKAIQRLLTVQGVARSQIQVISFGEERPAAIGHDEQSWALNRRVELLYSGN